ncbi:MAG TPA: acyltransferase [Candidatus Sulfotelmatobacter sp.]|nr:acyltransferase [Candidatus Sulfotelmatobacter sp.]
MPELDSLRGIAILLVLFFHGFNLPAVTSHLRGLPRLFVGATLGGWTGVYLFFVLSGFLITGILLDSKSKPNYYRRFYIRRALRILPAFYLLLLLLSILPRTGWLDGRRVGWPFIVLSFFYLANMASLFHIPSQYTVLWSLAVEEHFYLLWPTAVRRFSQRVLMWSALALCIICPVLRGWAFWLGDKSAGGYTWLVADSLAIGALLPLLSRGPLAHRGPMRRFSLAALFGGCALLAALTPFGIWRGVTFCGWVFRLTAINLLCTGILGLTLLAGTSRWRWLVQRPVLRFFGEISYGLYLIHMLASDFVDHWMIHFFPAYTVRLTQNFDLVAFRFLINSAFAVGVAYFSRRYFEEAFLRLKDRWAPSTAKSSAQAIAYPAASRPARQTA